MDVSGLDDDGEDSASVKDVARGLEPTLITAVGLSREHVESLSRFEQYTVDSVLPDGTSIAHNVPPHFVRGEARDRDESDDEDGEVGCSCQPEIEGGWSCTRGDGDVCDCVGAYGNFYTTSGLLSNGYQTLNLDALPERWPLVECSYDCLCRETCSNRLTQRGVRVPLAVRPVSQAGLGIFYTPSSPAILSKGTFITLYTGEYLTTLEARNRWSTQSKNTRPGEGNYILTLRLPDLVIHIDPRRIGNVGRFLNHSCDPNCVIQVVRWGAGSWPRAAIFTKRDIVASEELTFDYGNASGSEAWDGGTAERDDQTETEMGRTRCLCGTTKCRGWMPFDETL